MEGNRPATGLGAEKRLNLTENKRSQMKVTLKPHFPLSILAKIRGLTAH